MNLFKEMFYAVKSPGSYHIFLKNKKFKIFSYGVVLLFLYFFLTIVVPFARFQLALGGVNGIVERYVPEFLYQDGILWVEEPIETDDGLTYVMIDTSPEFYLDDFSDYKSRFAGYQNVVITDGYEVLAKSEGQYIRASLEDILGPDSYDNDSIDTILPLINGILGAGIVIVFVAELAFFFFGILILSLIGLIVNSVTKAGLSFGHIFIFSIYSRTLSLAVKALVSFLPFGIPFFWVINFGISVIYLYLACKSIKKDAEPAEVIMIQ